MPELIAYSWGRSSLGDFIAARSTQGLVAFEFTKAPGAGLETVRERVPNARLEHDADGLQDLIRALEVVVEAPASRAEIDLDPRGSDYQRTVWQLVRRIPAGETCSYGDLAAELGTRDARDATEAIAANGIAILIPCHRVVKRDGSISGYRWGVGRKRALLERERSTTSFRLT